MFTLKDVTYRDIVDIPHLDIPSGKVTCIVGRSGSGKTTTLRMLNRMISPDTGTILYKGTPISEIDPVRLRRQVVMLPQTPVMFDGTIRDNLLIGLQFSEREPVPDDALRRVMEIMDLRKKLDDDAATLSRSSASRWGASSSCGRTPRCWTSHRRRWTRAPSARSSAAWPTLPASAA